MNNISRRAVIVSLLGGIATASTSYLYPRSPREISGKASVDPSFAEFTENIAGVVDHVLVEDSGWTALIVGRWQKSAFPDFLLEESGNFRVVFTVRSHGFERTAVGAIPSTHIRTVVATKPLRVSLAGPPLDLSSIDEAPFTGGLRRVRVALSSVIHHDDEILSVEFHEGWRKGCGRENAKRVQNASIQTVELPTMRWAVPTLIRSTSDHDLWIDMVVASSWPIEQDAVAAVKFVGSDGINTNDCWIMAASSSSGWGDTIRTWGASAQRLCEGLNPGPITVHAEIFPWIGKMRATGSGHSTNFEDGLQITPAHPVHVLWDPEGRHIPEVHVYVDPQLGTTDPSKVTVGTSLDLAKSGSPASSPSVAAEAIRRLKRQISAANGWPASLSAGDNGIITLAAGVVHRFGLQSVGAGASTRQARMIIQGDPTFIDARRKCVIDVGDRPAWRYNLILLRNMTLRIGRGLLPFSSAVTHIQNVEVIGTPGLEDNGGAVFLRVPNFLYNSISGSSWTRTNVNLQGTNMRFSFIRSCIVDVSIQAPLILNNSSSKTNNKLYIHGIKESAIVESSFDHIVWGNKIYSNTVHMLYFPTELIGTRAEEYLIRYRMINNLFEMADGSSAPFGQIGGSGLMTMRNCLFEGNTFVGQRFNFGYNDPKSSNIELQSSHNGNVIRNNYFDHLPTKHDTFYSPTHGIRAGLTKSWSILYGCGYLSNVFGHRWENLYDFKHEFYGIGAVRSPVPGVEQGNSWTRFKLDRAQFGGGKDRTGHGDYSPTTNSPLIGMCSTACIDEDAFGVRRATVFSAGCAEAGNAMTKLFR